MVPERPMRELIRPGQQDVGLFDGISIVAEAGAFEVCLERIDDWVVADAVGRGPVRVMVTQEEPGGPRAGYLALSLMLSGGARDPVMKRPRLSAHAGEIALYAMGSAASFEFAGRFRYVVICIPVAAPGSVPLLLNTPISAEHGAGALLGAVVRALASQAGRGSGAAHLTPMLDGVASLVAGCFALGAPTAQPSNARRLRGLARIQDHMADHLADRDMRAGEVARGCGMSLRTLQRVLHAEGESFAELRLRLRLERAAAMLGRAAPHERIGDVARCCGFDSDAHFSRAFRTMYATSPRDFRAEARALDQHLASLDGATR